jgi:hypothetical protein
MVMFAGAAAIILAQAAPTRAAITFGQVDDFEDGTLQSWEAGGAANPVGPSNVATDGPAGTDDNFLRLRSDASGAGGKLVVFNTAQWAGDYLGAGVSAIRMQVNNAGSTDLVLRLILTNFGTGQSLTTVAPVGLASGSGWTAVSFSLASSNLAGGNYAAVMSAVSELNLVHAPAVIDDRRLSPPLTAQLRLDNIAAVPEPGTALLVGLGMVALMLVAAGRSHRPA